MSSQVLIVVGVLVVAALVIAAVALFSPGRRAARRARALAEAEQAERMRHDPNAPHDPEEYRWDAKRADNIHNLPGHL